jgi:hypothetical protein
VVGAAAPLVKALLDSEIVATPTAIETVTEQAETAKTAPAGIDGDQAIYLSRKTTGNFVSELLRSVIRGESAFAWYRAGIYRAGGTFTAVVLVMLPTIIGLQLSHSSREMPTR